MTNKTKITNKTHHIYTRTYNRIHSRHSTWRPGIMHNEQRTPKLASTSVSGEPEGVSQMEFDLIRMVVATGVVLS